MRFWRKASHDDVAVDRSRLIELEQHARAASVATATIEFTIDGIVLDANENFLRCMGYTLEEIRGQHHRLFVDSRTEASAEYADFWRRLKGGEAFKNRFNRVGKGGRVVVIDGSYVPIKDAEGRISRVIKVAIDVTREAQQAAELERQAAAVDQTLAMIEFQPDGTIINANANFLKTVGYDLQEVKGTHHRKFVVPAYAVSAEYAAFWARLRSGESHRSRFNRVGKGGKPVWIEAIYFPVMDTNSQCVRVVKYASDVTAVVEGERVLQQAVQEVQGVVRAAIEGNLLERVSLEGKSGLVIALAESINALIENMSSLVSQVKVAANEVYRGAEEISAGNQNLSQRTEEQASSLEETASSMEEMTSTVKQNADNAGQANQLAMAAREQADKGGAVVSRAVKAMTEINESSKKIADIISVIDEIAFQTNLLALNAAVEAARAGEQGRGFAVVASEVRNLASRSATAAKEIKELIQDSVKRVEDGSTLVTQSGATLEQIVTAVKKVSDIIAEITAAGREQSSGIEQVNKAVMQLDELTQQNAALVEQAAAASQSMAEQARSLSESMAKYHVGSASASATVVKAPRVASAAPAQSSKPPAVERRRANRPWSKRVGSSAAHKSAASAPAPKAAARSTTDAEWQEF
jgi:methyl-accepting chemotaxis protein